jgi:hypothetical protein
MKNILVEIDTTANTFPPGAVALHNQYGWCRIAGIGEVSPIMRRIEYDVRELAVDGTPLDSFSVHEALVAVGELTRVVPAEDFAEQTPVRAKVLAFRRAG